MNDNNNEDHDDNQLDDNNNLAIEKEKYDDSNKVNVDDNNNDYGVYYDEDEDDDINSSEYEVELEEDLIDDVIDDGPATLTDRSDYIPQSVTNIKEELIYVVGIPESDKETDTLSINTPINITTNNFIDIPIVKILDDKSKSSESLDYENSITVNDIINTPIVNKEEFNASSSISDLELKSLDYSVHSQVVLENHNESMSNLSIEGDYFVNPNMNTSVIPVYISDDHSPNIHKKQLDVSAKTIHLSNRPKTHQSIHPKEQFDLVSIRIDKSIDSSLDNIIDKSLDFQLDHSKSLTNASLDKLLHPSYVDLQLNETIKTNNKSFLPKLSKHKPNFNANNYNNIKSPTNRKKTESDITNNMTTLIPESNQQTKGIKGKKLTKSLELSNSLSTSTSIYLSTDLEKFTFPSVETITSSQSKPVSKKDKKPAIDQKNKVISRSVDKSTIGLDSSMYNTSSKSSEKPLDQVIDNEVKNTLIIENHDDDSFNNRLIIQVHSQLNNLMNNHENSQLESRFESRSRSLDMGSSVSVASNLSIDDSHMTDMDSISIVDSNLVKEMDSQLNVNKYIDRHKYTHIIEDLGDIPATLSWQMPKVSLLNALGSDIQSALIETERNKQLLKNTDNRIDIDFISKVDKSEELPSVSLVSDYGYNDQRYSSSYPLTNQAINPSIYPTVSPNGKVKSILEKLEFIEDKYMNEKSINDPKTYIPMLLNEKLTRRSSAFNSQYSSRRSSNLNITGTTNSPIRTAKDGTTQPNSTKSLLNSISFDGETNEFLKKQPKYNVNNRLMGWKLTNNPSRRNDLISILDMLHEKRGIIVNKNKSNLSETISYFRPTTTLCNSKRVDKLNKKLNKSVDSKISSSLDTKTDSKINESRELEDLSTAIDKKNNNEIVNKIKPNLNPIKLSRKPKRLDRSQVFEDVSTTKYIHKPPFSNEFRHTALKLIEKGDIPLDLYDPNAIRYYLTNNYYENENKTNIRPDTSSSRQLLSWQNNIIRLRSANNKKYLYEFLPSSREGFDSKEKTPNSLQDLDLTDRIDIIRKANNEIITDEDVKNVLEYTLSRAKSRSNPIN